ncbi:MAG: Crp/Fnr family transcriptional regulator [Oliverpabstia sp.]
MTNLSSKYYPLFEEVGMQFTLRAGNVLYTQDDQSSNLYLVKSGRVRMFYIGENGKEITYRIIGEGQLIGEAAFLSHLQQATISAVTDTTLVTCSIQSLYPHIYRHSELNRIIFELLTENYIQLCNQIKRLTINDSTKRVASYLVDLTENDHEELGIIDHILPYTQEELSVCLNLHRTTVSKVLADFAKRGLVRLGYRKLQVTDLEGLRDVLQ